MAEHEITETKLEEANHMLEERVRARSQELEENNRALGQEIAQRARLEEEQRRLDQRIQATQKMEGLGQLAGGIAHDFNNIFVSILCNAELRSSCPGRETSSCCETTCAM